MLTINCLLDCRIFLFILPILNSIILIEAESGYCKSSESNKICCTNYHEVNGVCTKCPIGSYGENCSQYCPNGTYGELCAQKCECKANQQCNRRFGCLDCRIDNNDTDCEAICPDNFYGKSCSQKCHCKSNQHCDRISGCIDCRPGSFDGNCSNVCSGGFFKMFCESYLHIFWIIPILLGTVIFIIICVCRRCRKAKPRNFVDIPTYLTETNDGTRDDYDHIAYNWNNNALDRSNIRKSALETEKREATCDGNLEGGVYNTLNLQVVKYEEPVKHQPLKRSKSESSFLYAKTSISLEPSAFDIIGPSNCTRTSTLRLKKNRNRNNHEDFNMYDLATFQEKNKTSQEYLFLQELSSHLFNLKKY